MGLARFDELHRQNFCVDYDDSAEARRSRLRLAAMLTGMVPARWSEVNALLASQMLGET